MGWEKAYWNSKYKLSVFRITHNNNKKWKQTVCSFVNIKTSRKSPHEQAQVLVKYAWCQTGLIKALSGWPGQLDFPAGQVFFIPNLLAKWARARQVIF